MTVRYASVQEAIERGGLRMVVVCNVPSPSGDAASDPILLDHRDMVYAEHLELPLSL